MTMKVLALNPGSTSTKVALFEDGAEVWNETQRYDVDVLGKYASVMEQEDFRLEEITAMLGRRGVTPGDLDAVVGRGGLLHPIESGTYAVNEKMLSEVRECKWGCHASNLGALLAGIMFFWVAGKEFVLKSVNQGAPKPVGNWLYPLAKYVYCACALIALIAGSYYGGIG